MKPATYRGQVVEYAAHDRKADTYSLIAPDGECIAELKTREFLSLPNRKQMEVRNGGHRRTTAQNQRRADRKSSDSWFTYYDPAIGPINPQTATTNTTAGLTTFSSLMSALEEVEKPKPPLKREGIIAGEIVGYRCWRIENGLLHSVYQRDCWKPGEVLEGRELGDWDLRGIHAWKDPASKQYHDYIRSYLNDVDPFGWSALNLFAMMAGKADRLEPRDKRPAMVTGTVFLWGDVVEHERGWRAEFARVRSIDWLYPNETMMGREGEKLAEFQRMYGVAA